MKDGYMVVVIGVAGGLAAVGPRYVKMGGSTAVMRRFVEPWIAWRLTGWRRMRKPVGANL